jgi:hypothetical protein
VIFLSVEGVLCVGEGWGEVGMCVGTNERRGERWGSVGGRIREEKAGREQCEDE